MPLESFRIAFAIYAIAAVALAVWLRGRARRSGHATAEQFWTTERRVPGWAAGLSLSASMLSISWSCVYGIELVYTYGVSGVWLLSVPWLAVLAVYFFAAPRIRRIPAFSQPEMAARRFGQGIRWLLAPALSFVFVAWCGAEIYAAGRVLSPFLGISPAATMTIAAAVVAAYSTLGGLPSVIATDVAQFCFVAIFLVVVAASAVGMAAGAGGFWHALAQAPPPPGAPRGAFDPWAAGIAFIGLTFAAYLPGWLSETDIWIRISATRSVAETRSAMAVTIVNSALFVGVAPLVIGLAALVIYPAEGGQAASRLAGGEMILPALLRDGVAPGLTTLVLTGLLAAGLSTIDSTANVVALSLGYDLLLPAWTRRHPDREAPKLLLSRGVNVVAIALALAFAIHERSLMDIFYLSSAVLSAVVFPVMVAVLWRGATRAAAYASAAAGTAGILVFYVWERWGDLTDFEPDSLAKTGVSYILWALALAAAGFLAGQLLGKSASEA